MSVCGLALDCPRVGGTPVRFQGSPLGLSYKPLDAVAGTTEVKPFLANAVRATALPSRRS